MTTDNVLQPQPDTITNGSALRPAATPLRASVKTALQDYLEHVDAELVTDLYALVLAEVEAPMLEVVMHKVRHNQSKAAKLLGLNRGTLRTKLKQYDLLD
ncbi:MAG: DNA-binding transcriptional regulator Fis [Pseudomonadota bacterium]